MNLVYQYFNNPQAAVFVRSPKAGAKLKGPG